MNRTNIVFRRSALNWLPIFLGALLLPATQLKALIITTNCPDVADTLPQPKLIQSGCSAFGPVGYFSALPQFSSGGVYHLFAYNPASLLNTFGLARSDANGVFTWKVACSNGYIFPVNAQGRILSLQDLPTFGSNVTCFGV